MAIDYQTLLSSVSDYAAVTQASGYQLLRLALLKSAAKAVAPSVPTDVQSLLSNANVPGYAAATGAPTYVLIELALLGIVANNAGSGGGTGAWTHGAGTPIANSISTSTYGLYTNDTDSSLWTVSNGGWIKIA